MRRFVLALAAASFFVVSLSGSAWGTPTVKLKAEFVPVPGFRGTGNILEAGAALHSEWTIEGTEYGGFPPPVVGINLYLPSGTTIEPAGFPTCEKSVLEQKGPSGCPHSSAAGPVGSVLGIVSFGTERVEESATLQTFYAPGGGLQDYIEGHSPVFLEVLPAGHFVNLGGAGGYGPELSTEVPLVSTVPGAPFASIRSINEKWGSAIKSGKTIHYITVPGSCPSGGFPIKAEVIFDEAGSDPPVPEAVTAIYKAPCPKGAGGGKPPKEPEVKKVQFRGSSSDPEVVIKGKNLGTAPPTGFPVEGCGNMAGAGEVFGESLYFTDETAWQAGFGGDGAGSNCIGMIVEKWSKSSVTAKFGSAYDGVGYALREGDEFTLNILGKEAVGEVIYKGKAKS